MDSKNYLTFEEAKNLKVGDILYHTFLKNEDKTPQRWKVNREVKLWKRDLKRIHIPLKRVLKSFAYLDEHDFGSKGFCLAFKTKEEEL